MKASIILVTWSPDEKRFNLLKQTLKSLKESTDIDYELIVVDNGPKEQTDWLKTQKIDKHIINDQNKGIGYCWNKGGEVAEGEFVSLIDNDLLFSKDWLKECIDVLEKYPKKRLIAASCYTVHQAMPRLFLGELDEYFLWCRSCTAGTVFRNTDIKIFKGWMHVPNAGTKWLDFLKRKGYKFISLIFPKVVHRGINSSYGQKRMKKSGSWRNEWGFE